MRIKLILTTGKEVELTDQEFEELRNMSLFRGNNEISYVPYYPPVTPTYPANPWNPWGPNVIY